MVQVIDLVAMRAAELLRRPNAELAPLPPAAGALAAPIVVHDRQRVAVPPAMLDEFLAALPLRNTAMEESTGWWTSRQLVVIRALLSVVYARAVMARAPRKWAKVMVDGLREAVATAQRSIRLGLGSAVHLAPDEVDLSAHVDIPEDVLAAAETAPDIPLRPPAGAGGQGAVRRASGSHAPASSLDAAPAVSGGGGRSRGGGASDGPSRRGRTARTYEAPTGPSLADIAAAARQGGAAGAGGRGDSSDEATGDAADVSAAAAAALSELGIALPGTLAGLSRSRGGGRTQRGRGGRGAAARKRGRRRGHDTSDDEWVGSDDDLPARHNSRHRARGGSTPSDGDSSDGSRRGSGSGSGSDSDGGSDAHMDDGGGGGGDRRPVAGRHATGDGRRRADGGQAAGRAIRQMATAAHLRGRMQADPLRASVAAGPPPTFASYPPAMVGWGAGGGAGRSMAAQEAEEEEVML
jgi:hypothetical protein